MALRRHLRFRRLGEHGEACIGEAHGLERAHAEGVARQAVLPDLLLHVDDAAHLAEEPGIDLAGLEDVLVRPAEPHGLGDLEQTVRRRRAERGADGVLVVVAAEALDLDLVEAGQPGLEPAQRLCRLSWKVRPIAMTSPTDFIDVVSVVEAPGNFSKAKRGTLVTT